MGGLGGGPAAVAPSNVNGFGFYSASALAGYSTFPLVGQSGIGFSQNSADALGRWTTGATASMGYGRVLGVRSRLGIVYTPGVLVRPQALDRSRMFHFLNMNWAQGITERLSLNLGATASYSEMDQFAFSPARFSLVTSAPGSFDDFFAAISGGQFSNSQIASLLTGTPILEAGARSSIYGNQAFVASANARMNYKITPRTSWFVNGSGNRFQSVGVKGDSLDRRAIVPRTVSSMAATGVNFSITPKTSVGGSVNYNKVYSTFRDTGFVTATANIVQRLGQNAALTVSAGSGKSIGDNVRGLNSSFGSRILLTTQFTTRVSDRQTLMASYSRTFVDEFGLGAANMQMFSAGWSYAPLGSAWTGTIAAGYQRSELASASRNLQSYSITAGINRKLTAHAGMSFQAYFLQANNRLGQQFGITTQGKFESSGVRMLITWFPTPLEY